MTEKGHYAKKTRDMNDSKKLLETSNYTATK